MEKEFNLTVHVHVVLDDEEATEQTVRFLLEEDLRDKGWDATVETESCKGKTVVNQYGNNAMRIEHVQNLRL